MSDVMLIGVLRMPMDYPLNEIVFSQLVSRCREAADRIESDARLIERGQKAIATIEQIKEQIPTNWLDSLLTGKEAVIGQPPYNCTDIERLLLAIKKRMGKIINDN